MGKKKKKMGYVTPPSSAIDRFYSARIVKTSSTFFRNVKKAWFLGHISKKGHFFIRRVHIGDSPYYSGNYNNSGINKTNYKFQAPLEKDMTFSLNGETFRLDTYKPTAIVSMSYVSDSQYKDFFLLGEHAANGKEAILKTKWMESKNFEEKRVVNLIKKWHKAIVSGRLFVKSHSWNQDLKKKFSEAKNFHVHFDIRGKKVKQTKTNA